jgi:hypothetical protein
MFFLDLSNILFFAFNIIIDITIATIIRFFSLIILNQVFLMIIEIIREFFFFKIDS